MKTYLTSIFLLLFSLFGYSQNGHLYGEIAFNNDEPVLGAQVVLRGGNIERMTSSGIDGEFAFKNLPYGTYTIETHSLEAKPHTIEAEINAVEQTLKYVLEITEFQDLDEVHLRTKTQKEKIEDEGFAVNVIETKEVSQRNIQTTELLNTTVGVKIRQNGGLGSQAQFSLNGLSGSAVRIFIDGIPISIYGSSFSVNSIPTSMIKRIEVYKGVVPGYLADDALGGAINIVMHKGTKSNFNASVSFGSFNTIQASVNGLYRFDDSGFTVKASIFNNYSDNNYKVWGRSVVDKGLGGVQTPIVARRFNDAYRSTGGMFQVGYTNVKWADQFFIGVTGSDDFKEVQHGTFMTTTPYKDRFLESDALLANLTYQKKDLFTKGLDVNINGAFGKRNRNVNDTVAKAYSWTGEPAIDFKGDEYDYSWGSQQEGGPTLATIKRNVASIRTGVSYGINRHHKFVFNHFYSGIDREDSDALKSLLENTFVGTRDLDKNILSLTYELNAFNNKLKANLFGKYYQQKTVNIDPFINSSTGQLEDDVTSANNKDEGYGFAISYALTPTISILTSAEKAVRLPDEIEVFGNDGDNVIANPSINPESSENFNLGFRFGAFRIKKHAFTISTNLFTRNIKDRIGLPIETSLNVNDETIFYENQGSGTSKGYEASLDYSYNNNFKFNFNISQFELKIVNRGVEIDVPNTPFDTMNAGLSYGFSDLFQKNTRLNLYYNLYYTGEFSYIVPQGSNTVGDDFFKVPEQLAQDFGLSYSFPNEKVVMSFDIKNIFDKPVYDNLSIQKPGRAFYLKLNYFINKF
ncbi:TonB-dependent receptor [Tamlana agarivorans]|uniref:TonB-dependent receptor n=1 Tax=Pseudotamlana agarivorans TaxID=481183 RepID=A0ACC5U825_9FLAO|nr:TonB-dependent receptor plug domain-containing protein [Tamlana agarivorans]MBU2950447.1 TonB-dependent receptor [Tamlana agarivorans]